MSTEISNKRNDSSPDGVTWGPWSAVIVVVVVFLVAQLVASYVVIAAHAWFLGKTNVTNWLNSSILAQFLYVLIAEVLTVSMVVWFIRWRKGSIKSIGLRKANWEDVPWAIIGYVGYLVIYIVVVGVLSGAIKSLNVNQSQQLGFSETTTGWALVPIFISLVLLPAVAEEFLFRGFLFSGLKKSMPVIWAAVLTSLIFASPHLLESNGGGLLWIAGIDTFVLSLVLCWLRQKTKRLYAGMGVHALKNAIAFISLFLLHVH